MSLRRFIKANVKELDNYQVPYYLATWTKMLKINNASDGDAIMPSGWQTATTVDIVEYQDEEYLRIALHRLNCFAFDDEDRPTDLKSVIYLDKSGQIINEDGEYIKLNTHIGHDDYYWYESVEDFLLEWRKAKYTNKEKQLNTLKKWFNTEITNYPCEKDFNKLDFWRFLIIRIKKFEFIKSEEEKPTRTSMVVIPRKVKFCRRYVV